MKHRVLPVLLLVVAVATPLLAAPHADPWSVLAKIPAERLASLPRPFVNAYLAGEIETPQFLAGAGMALPSRPEGTPSELVSKMFLSHWAAAYNLITGTISDDSIGEPTIAGACGGTQLTAAPTSPYMSNGFYADTSGRVATPYYYAPSDSTTCTTTTNNLVRYFYTWIKSTSGRNVQAWVGSSDNIKVWVNGTLVLNEGTHNAKAFTVDEYKVPVTLIGDWNLVVVKQAYGELSTKDANTLVKYFSLRFVSDASGTPVTDLIAAFDPTCPDDQAGGTMAFVPAISHAPGAGGSAWRTDVRATNGTYMRWSYVFRYYRQGTNGGSPDAIREIVLDPWETRTYADALANPDLLGVSGDQTGYFSFGRQGYSYTSGFYYTHLLGVKLYNQAASGTFGMDVPPYGWGEGSTTPVFHGLRNGAYRTNFGAAPTVNAGAACRVKLTMRGPGIPTPVVKEFPADPNQKFHGAFQINDVFAQLGLGSLDTSDASLLVEITSDTNTYWIPWASINDGNPGRGFTGTSDPQWAAPGRYIFDPTDTLD